jgi:excisionase family DNA binding protein
MLMHEWMKYRQRQIKEAAAEAELEGEETVLVRREASAATALRRPTDQARELIGALEESSSESVRQRLQTLVGRQARLPLELQETAQRKGSGGLGETREELIQRLLDPTLTLQETATLLAVCPATVRRYTNRGALRCFRTPGNQRRFRLSDVLDFMELGQGGVA